MMLASVNLWKDSAFKAIEHRVDFLNKSSKFRNLEFLIAFVNEDFFEIQDEIPTNILEIALSKIEMREDKQTVSLTKQFPIEYTTNIAKSSKEDWLAFIGLKDAISDKEERFIERLKRI